MNLKLYSAEKPNLYIKKKVELSLIKNNSSNTMELFDDEIHFGKNLGYCLTSRNNEHSILNDLLNSNLFNDSLSLESTGISHKVKLNQKIIELIRDTIRYHLANIAIFPIFQFNRGFTIVFHDQKNKLNNFVKEFGVIYSIHDFTKILSNTRMRYKIINPVKVKKLMKLFEGNPQKLYGKGNCNSNKGGKGNKKKLVMNPIITMELLTKIPNKQPEKIIKNRRLEMQYGKAKEAAIGIRRLEYAYNMKKGFMFNKQLFQKSVSTIQKWWRSVARCYNEFLVISQIQSHYRGHISRIAMYDTLHVIDDVLPFLNRVDNILSRNKIEFFFNQLYRRYAYLAIHHKLEQKIEMIKRNIKAYMIRKRPNKLFNKPFITKCNMLKYICELSTQKKIDLIQSTTRYYLMNNNDKIMKAFGYNVHPYLYFKLKYSKKNKEIYKRKIVKFHRFYNKLQLLNLRVNKKIPNAFEYFRIAVTRKHFNRLVQYDREYVYKRKNILMNKFVTNLIRETKLREKYLDRWQKNTKEIIKIDRTERVKKIIETITTTQNANTLKKYYDTWKYKKTLLYQMVYIFRKAKVANANAYLHEKKVVLFNELFNKFRSLRVGRREIELSNSIARWRDKINKFRKRDNLLIKTINNTESREIIVLQKKSLKILIDKCNAKKREALISKALTNKEMREHCELNKYFAVWKKDCQQKILKSIYNKTFNKEQGIIRMKIDQLKNKCISIRNRELQLKNTIDHINNLGLLKRHLGLYRKKTHQIHGIECSLTKLINHFTLKNNNNQLKKYVTTWRFSTVMTRIMSNEHNKWLLNHLKKWQKYTYLINLIRRVIQRKDKFDTFTLRKYYDRWRKYNEIYLKLILPLYQKQTQLFEQIILRPIEKRRTIFKSIAFFNISAKAIENRFAIASNLKRVILTKHTKDLQAYFFKWRESTDDIIFIEKTNQRKDYLLKDIFTSCTSRYSSGNLLKYFILWKKRAPYYLLKGVLSKQRDHGNLIQLFFSRWKKQSFKHKLNLASDKITNRIKERNHFRRFCKGLNWIFIKKLALYASIIKKRSQIQKIIFKNIFSYIRSKLIYRSQLKSLINLSSIANYKFRLIVLLWKLKARRISLIQKRYYSNVNRRILTNHKKTALGDLLKKAKSRREILKGKFFKKYKQASGVYYIKCSHVNLQVFFLYRQKKYLSKRKYRMIKYVINQLNRKLLKKQSIKRYIGDWRRTIRFSILIDCINKRIKKLDQGTVALRVSMKKWS